MPSHASSSLPGLTRQSILFAKEMDARVKPAHDEWANPSRRRTAVALAFVSFLALSFSSSGLAQDAVADFYRGKQINLIVGYGPGGGYEFVNKVVGGAIPKEYISSIDAGIREAMEAGVLAGFPVVDIKVTLVDGSYHDVDSSEMAFKVAGSMAFKEASKRAKPVLLEPVMSVEVVTPKEFLGEVIGDLSRRRGKVHGQEQRLKVGSLDVVLYPLYHPAAALYTPAMLTVLEEDFARLPELLGRSAAPVEAPPVLEPVAAEPAVQLGLF